MIKASVDTKKLENDLKRLTKDLNKTAEDSIIEMAQIGGVQLAYRCKPYGINEKSKNIAEKAVYSDFNIAYKSLGQTFNILRKYDKDIAMAYARAVHDNDLEAAEKYADRFIEFKRVTKSDDGGYLESIRGPNGRVRQAEPISLVEDSEIDTLKEKKVVTAGTAKAGWLQASKSLKSKSKIPKWLKKPFSNLGSSNIQKRGWETIVTLINHVKYTSDVITESKVKAAVENAYRNQVKKLQKQVEHLAKKF